MNVIHFPDTTMLVTNGELYARFYRNYRTNCYN